MALEVTLRNTTSGVIADYSTYDEARDAASSGDVIRIYKNLNEQIDLLDGVDLYIDPGTVITYNGAGPTITDNNEECVCNIVGGGTIKNTYTGSAKQSCIEISNANSVVNIECFQVSCDGEDTDEIEGACINITSAKNFRLICDRVTSKYNTAMRIKDCKEIFLRINSVRSGSTGNPNAGAPVILIEQGDDDPPGPISGSFYINELICTGYGSCFVQKHGLIAASINKLLTIQPPDPSTASAATVFLDTGISEHELILYFDEIINYFGIGGDSVQIIDGKASLIGRKIYSTSGKSLDLTDSIISAFIQCDEIISLTEGINIANSNEPIVIDANFIEGGIGNDGVVRSASDSNYVLRNARIKCTDTSNNSVCIYLPESDSNTQTIELENIILVTGNTTNGDTIRRITSNTMEVKNLGLFVNKAIDRTKIILLIGTGSGSGENFKYIVSSDIQ